MAFSQQEQKPSPTKASSKPMPADRGNNATGVKSPTAVAAGNKSRPARPSNTSEAPSPTRKAEK